MAKKVVIAGVSVLALAVAGYFAGVYYTGVKTSQMLSSTKEVVANYSQTNHIDFKASYEEVEHGFFTDHGKFIVEYKGEQKEIKADVNKGFLNAQIDFDTEALVTALSRNEAFVKESISAEANVKANAFSSDVEFALNAKADYQDATKKSFNTAVNISVTGDEKVVSSINIDSLDFEDIYVGNISVNSQATGLKKIENLGNGKIVLSDIRTKLFDSKTLSLEFNSFDYDKDGNFKENIKLYGDNLNYMKDYNIDVTLSPLNINKIYEASQKENNNSYEAFNSISNIDIAHLDLTLNRDFGMFIGVRDLDKLPLTSKGSFTVGEPGNFRSVNGSLEINSISNNGAEQFIKEKDGKFVALIEVQNGKVFLNGAPFL